MEKPVRFSVALPKDLHRRFKMRCVATDTRMVDVIFQLVERDLIGKPGSTKRRRPRPRVPRCGPDHEPRAVRFRETDVRRAIRQSSALAKRLARSKW